jgi:hypothetical protein
MLKDKNTNVQMLNDRIASHVMAIHASSFAPSGIWTFVMVGESEIQRQPLRLRVWPSSYIGSTADFT